MRLIIHDLGPEQEALIEGKGDAAFAADGKYAPCQGCFHCWTKHPAECFMKDRLQQVCRLMGEADELVIVTRNLYGGYGAAVKNVLDRSIGTSTPFSTYRGGQMHHTLRYGKHDLWKVFVYGDVTETEKLRTPADHDRILEQLRDADAAVFALPLYVDGVPSHVLRFLEKMEAFCRENGLKLRVYCIANNGFIEGKQNEPLMQTFERFCERAGLEWGGGVGIGGGVMLNVTRILFFVDIGLLVLNTLLSVINTGSFFPKEAWESFLTNAALLLYFNAGLLFYLARMGGHIRRGTCGGKKYTRILIPSFVFILFADIFFVIVSVLDGGIFLGWLAKKKYRPEESSEQV